MIAGRYELDREIGRGGMGAVWLAHDTTLGREVAVKRLGATPSDTEESDRARRAEREARLAARLNHPHVVHVFDLIIEDEGQWLVMEYVDGQTLASLIRAEGPLSHDRASSLLGQAADALAAAHGAGIVHRDVKPSNILVSASDEVKLSDFGIARAEADPSLTQTGLVTGSPAYLSPEVASGHMATTASDVWSLGATLFHALSGRAPYEVGDNLMGALFRIVHEEPPRLPEAGRLAPLLDATMTKDPETRWSMAQVRDFLHGDGQAGPVLASTQVLPLAAPPSAPSGGSSGAGAGGATRPVPPPPAPDSVEEGRPRRAWLPLGVGAALVLVLGALTWFLLADDDDAPTPTIDRPAAAQRSGGGQQGGGGAASRAAAEKPTAEGMETFISDYLATAPSSPQTTFEMLTPAFQRASGGFGGYSGYWTTIAEADPVEIRADPERLVVEYVVDYTRKDGTQTTDEVALQLRYEDGRYLVADEA